MHLNRRRFLLTTAAFAATAPATVAADPPTRWRAAIIGHTGRGDYGHGLDRIFQGRPDIEVVAVADPNDSGRDKVARAIGEPRQWAGWRAMLERERPQLVSLAMRHADQHAEIAQACLEMGAHIYLEKPFVRSPDEADPLLALAHARQRRLAVAHTMRLAPGVQQLRRALEEGLLGELREMRAYGKQDTRAGGEDMMVLGTHLFDLLRLFAGDPLSVTAQVWQQGRQLAPTDRRLVKDNVGWVAGDQVWAQFAFNRGFHATFTSDARLRETVGHWGIEFHGSRGVARLNCDLVPQVFIRQTAPWAATGRTDTWRPLVPDSAPAGFDPQAAPVSDWLEAIRAGREPECSARNGAWAVEMVSGVYASALAGRRLSFPLADRRHPLAPA